MAYKSNIGLIKSVGINASVEDKIAGKKIVLLNKLFKKLRVEESSDNSGIKLRLIDYDAEDMTATWKELEYRIEKELPNVKVEYFEGLHDEESDELVYNYEHLEITL